LVVINVEQVVGLDPEHVWTFWRTQKHLTLSGVRSPGHQAYGVAAIPTALSLAREITGQKGGGGGRGVKRGKKKNEKREKGAKQEHTSRAKGTVESQTMEKI